MDYLIRELIENDVSDDVIVCDYSFVNEEGNITEQVNNLKQNKIDHLFSYNVTYSVERVCASGTFPFPFHSLYYKTETFYKSRKIDEKCFYVDIEYALYPFENAKTLRFSNANVYMYLLGREGQSVSPENYCKNRANLETVFFSLLDFYTSDTLSEEKKDYIFRRMTALYSDIVDVYLYIGNAEIANNWFIPIEDKLKAQAQFVFERMNSNHLLKAIRLVHYHGYSMLSDFKKKR